MTIQIEFSQKLNLPWKYEILAAVRSPIQDKLYVLTQRDDVEPYVVHQVGQDGGCYHGDYFRDLKEAKQCLVHRSMLVTQEPSNL